VYIFAYGRVDSGRDALSVPEFCLADSLVLNNDVHLCVQSNGSSGRDHTRWRVLLTTLSRSSHERDLFRVIGDRASPEYKHTISASIVRIYNEQVRTGPVFAP
jgi:hypothetical protein